MVTADLFHSAAGRLHDLASYGPIGDGTIAPFQRGADSGVMFLPHLPQVRLTRPAHRAGIRNVKDIFQAGLASPVFSDERDAFGPGLHPAAHSTVPQLHAGARGGIRALGVDQELVIERIFVDFAGRRQILHPAAGVPRDGLGGLAGQFGYPLQFCCHIGSVHLQNKRPGAAV